MIRNLAFLLLTFSQPLLAEVDILIATLNDTPDPVARGGNITYTITTGNQGTVLATDVVTTVAIPPTTTFVSVNHAACTHDGATPGTLTCNFGDLQGQGPLLPTGEAVTVDLVVATTAQSGQAPNPNPIGIEASVTTTTSGEVNTGNNILGQNTTVVNGADLQVLLSAAPNPVNTWDTVTYTVDVSNNGPNDAINLSLVLDLNVNLSYVSASGTGWTCSASGQTVTCTAASLANAASASTLNINAQVTGAGLGTVTSTATISADTTDPIPNNNVATADVTINAGTDVAVTIAASSTNIIQGDTVTLSLRPRNNGQHDADNVEVTYTVPTDFTLVSGPTGTGWTCDTTALPNISCTRPLYGVGSTDDITLDIQAPATVPAPTNYTNSTAISTTTPEAILSNNNDSVVITVNPDGADLSISKSKGPQPVAMGSPITTTITVTNNGPRDAASGTVAVQDVLNTAVETFVSASGTNWSCVDNSPNIDCTYNAVLANGASATLTIITTAVITANATEAVTNTATTNYGGTPGDYNSSNNTDTATVTSTQAIADLVLSKSAVAGLAPGDDTDGDPTRLEADPLTSDLENSIVYTIILTNNGPNAATGITLTDPIPGYVAGGTVVSVTSIVDGAVTDVSADWSCTVGSTVSCTQVGAASLANGAQAIFTIAVSRPLYDGLRTNTASAYSADVGDNDRSNNTASSSVTVEPVADVQLQSKTVTPNPVKAGVEATYTITVRNNGPSTAQNVELTDTFNLAAGDTGFTFISWSNPAGTCSGLTAGTSYTAADSPQLTCQLGSMSNGQAQSVTVVIRPNYMASPPTPRIISNVPAVTTDTYDDNSGNNVLAAVDLEVVQDEVDLLINNSDVPDPVAWDPAAGGDTPNNDVVYNVDFTNNGPSYATGVNFVYSMTPKTGKTVRFECDEAGPSDACGTSADTCTVTAGSNPVTGPATLELTCTASTVAGKVDEMAAGDSGNRYLTFRILSKPDSTGDTHNTNAVISANERESNNGNNAEAETTSVLGRVDLVVGKTASPASVQLHEPFDWIITVTNNGPVESTTTTLTDTLPANMLLHGTVTVSNPDDATASCTLTGQDLSCDLGLLNNGSTATIIVPMQVDTFVAASQDNCASAITNGLDLVTSNNINVCGTVTVNNSYFPSDYGDAPDTTAGTGTGDYDTTFANGGPRHLQPGGTWLGACVDADGAGTLQNAAANADDADAGSVQAGTCTGNDDEDGVVLPPAFIDGQTASLDITIAGATCALDGWIDFNRDGDFNDAGEQVFNALSLTVGTSTQTISVPSGISVGTSYARFRCSSAGGLTPVEEVTGGEVEDYLVSLQPNPDSSPTPTDYGDAPDTGTGTASGNYQTWGTDDGASHVLGTAGGAWMGACVDSDADGQQNVAADADDLAAAGGVPSPVTSGTCATAGDDEDGVTFNNLLRQNSTYDITVSNGSPNSCLLNAWIDFNADGDFADAGEQIATDATLNAGNSVNLAGTVPTGYAGETYARFRCSSVAGLDAFGAAPDGEVEDYRVVIAPDPAVTATDLGDAPDPTAGTATEDYATTLTDSGAEHLIAATGPWLGACVDSDDGTAQSLDALADDQAAAAGPNTTAGTCAVAGDDEDGVQFNSILRENGTLDITVSNGSATACLLNAWIDYNRDGDFQDTGEQVATDTNLAAAGSVTLTDTVPTGSAGVTWARFRCSSNTVGPVGLALDGEVEDYRVQIQPDPAVTATDFGDAPDTSPATGYADLQTQLDNDGPAHVLLTTGPWLGNCVDSDTGTAQDLYATADDQNPAAGPAVVNGTCTNGDEDGVQFNSLIQEGVALDITVTASTNAACLLNAWIDYNRDGDFLDAGEQLVTDASLAAGGSLNITSVVPAGTAGNTWARFRCSTQTGLGPRGPAADGEVEDYRVEIQPDPASTAADFGDAPDSTNTEAVTDYSTVLANNGPSHVLAAGGPYLGACVDSDSGTSQALDALADDGAVATGPTVTLGTCAVANQDEDGLVFMSPLNRGASVRARITTGPDADCNLNLWIDFDMDGSFLGADEHVINDVLQTAGTTVDHRIQIPYTATEGDTYVRLRCSSDPGLPPTGPASDGEVEDYLATISAVLIIPATGPVGLFILAMALLLLVWRKRNALFD